MTTDKHKSPTFHPSKPHCLKWEAEASAPGLGLHKDSNSAAFTSWRLQGSFETLTFE